MFACAPANERTCPIIRSRRRSKESKKINLTEFKYQNCTLTLLSLEFPDSPQRRAEKCV